MDNHESYKLQYVLHYNTIVRTYVHNSANSFGSWETLSLLALPSSSFAVVDKE